MTDTLSNMRIARLTDHFEEPMTQGELCARTGLRQAVVSRYLSELMRSSPRKAHIASWRAGKSVGAPPMAVYASGPGSDVECTVRPLSGAERVRRFRLRKSEEGKRAEAQRMARARADWHPPAPDALTSAFFGRWA